MPGHYRFIAGALAWLLLLPWNPLGAQERRIGHVSFFGQEGFDTDAIRKALPFREGDLVPFGGSGAEAAARDGRWEQSIRDAVMRVIAREPTAVNSVCCDERGQLLVYIGLPSASVRPIRYNAAPDGTSSLPESLVTLSERLGELQFKAVAEGRAAEDYSDGYSLAKDDPELRKRQLAWRDEVRRNEASVYNVVLSSADARQRAIAASALGYARPTDRQIDALVGASFDADETVRNNAVRALAVVAMAQPDRGRRIPSVRYIDLLSSATWTDRNKGLMVLQALTAGRDGALLRDLRTRAWSPLIEMAQWPKGHALAARVILARIVGVDEQRLSDLVNEEPPNTLLEAVRAQR